MTSKYESHIGNILVLGVIFVTLLVTPWHNIEPISKPKLAMVAVVVGVAGLLFLPQSNLSYRIPNAFVACSLIVIALTCLNLVFNHQFISERIFGVGGRNFGALTLVSLTLLSLISSQVSDRIEPSRILSAIKLSSFIVAVYFLLQLQGFDRAGWIDSYGGVPSSTLGNPNFVSAFVAIGFLSTLPLLIIKQTKVQLKILILFVSTLEIYVAAKSNSFQGFVIILLGSLLVMFGTSKHLFLMIDVKKSRLAAIFAVVVFISFFAILRFREFLSLDSATVKARLDYWQAGLAMGLDSPLFGKGFDFFGESYFRFRSESAAIRSPGLFTDSAHNYFIDLFAFGGFPLLIATTLPMLLVFLKIVKSLSSSRNCTNQNQITNKVWNGLFIVWIAFFFQALISPFSLPLAYLGFLLSGFLFGSFIQAENFRDSFVPRTKKRISSEIATGRFRVNRILLKIILIPLFVSLPVLGVQPLIADAKFRDAIEQGDGGALYRIAMSQPQSFQTMRYAAEIFLQNELPNLARPVIIEMVEQNPENIAGWRLLRQVGKTDAEMDKAQAEIFALDPKNPELSKS